MSTKNKDIQDYTGREFVMTREFDAPRELVFQAWTDPAQLALWWGPRGFINPVCQWEAKVGNAIHVVMRAPNGTDYPMGGEFREVAPPERLVFTSGALDEKGNLIFEFLHTAIFVERNRKTQLTLRSRVLKTMAEANKYIGGFEAGMSQSLEKLAGQVSNKSVVIERTFNAPVPLVWQALTEKEKISQWSFVMTDFKAEVGFEFEFCGEKDDVKYFHRCRVVEAIPNKKLAYTWRYEGYEGNTLVTIELFAEGNGTRLKLTHEGLDTLPKTPDFEKKNFVQGWTHIIGSSLKGFLDRTGASDHCAIVISREFAAPRDLVWEAMSDPRHVVNWWGPRGFTTTVEKMDFRVGGEWIQVMHGPDGANYPNSHVFKEIVKPERIVFSHGGKREDGPSVSSVATWTFEAIAPGSTKVTIRMEFPTAAERDFVVKEFKAIEGGQQTLERLGEYLPGMK